MPDETTPSDKEEGDVMAGDRRIARTDTALPDWYASDAAYRPIPIVWFGGALVMQVVAIPVIAWLSLALIGFGPIVTTAFLLLASGFLWQFTWERGMQDAAVGWQIATGASLMFFLAIGVIGLFG